ncbi:uncharacterized protein LOC132192469 [Neocloeon triangulifer]|uniref:uncharacterized protein LOC132192469 n=1 Tax=Neocloeon triangulifer TaxID=2078957 RepID=UPI00286EDE76|nr:uncharacterized protein LOC132192469 [Neocloeon triangulifer]
MSSKTHSALLTKQEEEAKRRLDVLSSDYLNLFESSTMYDCSLRVRYNHSCQKVFRCHKIVLSVASRVFQAMFHGGFNEAKKGPDDEILIDDTSPAIFEAAMRFVYCRKAEFGNIPNAAEIYMFADKWQIKSLKEAADSFLTSVPLSLGNYAFMFEIFKRLNHEAGMKKCMEMISTCIKDIFQGEDWKKASLDFVMQVMKEEDLVINDECELLEGLVQWGAANALTDENGQPSDAQVREAIEEPLKMIRFLTMENQDFINFCSVSKYDIFTVEEKWNIVISITNKSAEKLPQNFSREERQRFSVKKLISVKLIREMSFVYGRVMDDPPITCFGFRTNKIVKFVGLKLMPFEAHKKDEIFEPDAEFLICNMKKEKIFEGSTKDFVERLGFYKARRSVVLDANTQYKLSVKYLNMPDMSKNKLSYQYLQEITSNIGDLKVILYGERYNMTRVCELIFVNPP